MKLKNNKILIESLALVVSFLILSTFTQPLVFSSKLLIASAEMKKEDYAKLTEYDVKVITVFNTVMILLIGSIMIFLYGLRLTFIVLERCGVSKEDSMTNQKLKKILKL